MPKQHGHGIDVSEAEERYLRGAFRRFALPWVLLSSALAAITAIALSRGEVTGAPEEVSALREEIATLQQSLAALATRIEPLESRVARVGSDLEKSTRRVAALESRPASDASGDDALELELRDAARRVAALEERVSQDAAAERIDALAARIGRVEDATRAMSGPSASPAAPAQ